VLRRKILAVFVRIIPLALAIGFGPAVAQPTSEADRTALGTRWTGPWEDGPFLFDADLQLKIDRQNQLEGSITWTIRRSPRPSDQAKIGLTGVEHVKGRYSPGARLLSFDGDRKDDPHSIIGLDKYRLLLSENGNRMGGITWNHGKWDGRFFLSR
jgi:hypothetical protein